MSGTINPTQLDQAATSANVIAEFLDCSKLSTCSRILIDGDLGAGKTILGEKLATHLDAKLISLDCFLGKDRSLSYWEQIKHDSLQEAISENPRVIIEGVCGLKVLAKIKVRPDYHIFMKLLNGSIGWEPGLYLFPGVGRRSKKRSRNPKSGTMLSSITKNFDHLKSATAFFVTILVAVLRSAKMPT